MRTRKEIEEVFKALDLLDEKKRADMLSLAKLPMKTERKPTYHIVSDDVTTTHER